MTITDRLYETGFQKGWFEGKQEGKQKGKKEGKQEELIKERCDEALRITRTMLTDDIDISMV